MLKSFYLRLFCVLCLFLVDGTAYPALATVVLDITKGSVKPLPLAIITFKGNTSYAQDVSKQITDIIVNDLEGCGLFRSINQEAFLEHPDFAKLPTYASWRKIDATALITGQVEYSGGNNGIKVLFRIFDPYAEKQIESLALEGKRTTIRRIAHKIADSIYNKILGETGLFDSRVVFIAEEGKTQKNRKKRLAIMDQDGENFAFLSMGGDLVLTPRFDSKTQRVLYMSYKDRVPKVYIYDLQSGKQQVIGNFEGMSFAPRFSPDGNYAAFSIAKDGTTSINEVNLHSKQVTRIISDVGAISTSPSYSPDGSRIVFNSDRGGSKQLYVANRDGSNIRRISFEDGAYAAPVWSPRGDFIAFVKMLRGRFYIGVMRPDGTGERLLTTSWLEESPTWSPNGRVIMFYRQKTPGAVNQLYAVDITGYNERLIPTRVAASDPAWSPLLQ